jgi:hypothetical protein
LSLSDSTISKTETGSSSTLTATITVKNFSQPLEETLQKGDTFIFLQESERQAEGSVEVQGNNTILIRDIAHTWLQGLETGMHQVGVQVSTDSATVSEQNMATLTITDSDCDGQTDEVCENDACIDHDGDGFNKETDECPSGRDCNDNDSEINPNADEICGNDKDNNCDGEKKECPENCTDKDGDGFGIEGQNEDCPREGIDCDDTNPNINPEAEEVCGNQVDENCDGKDTPC